MHFPQNIKDNAGLLHGKDIFRRQGPILSVLKHMEIQGRKLTLKVNFKRQT